MASDNVESGTLRCRLFGHKWSMDPPWTGKELRWQPHCERCGHEPEDIVITGSARNEIEHRV